MQIHQGVWPTKQTGQFISLEGIEGVGKSTLLLFLADYLRGKGLRVLKTREPGGCSIAESIRQILLTASEEPMVSDAELLLMFAGRAQHVAQVVRPALAQGMWVVCDRFVDASYAYQGAGRGMGQARVAALDQWALNGFKPDITLLLDAPVALALKRVAMRGQVKDRIEEQQHAFFERVRLGYLARLKADPERFLKIDASQSLRAVQADVKRGLDRLLGGQTHP